MEKKFQSTIRLKEICRTVILVMSCAEKKVFNLVISWEIRNLGWVEVTSDESDAEIKKIRF